MRVSYSDPQGPRLWRLAPYAAPLLLFLLAIVGAFPGATSAVVCAAAYALFHLIGLVPRRQQRMKVADLEAGPGFIAIRNAGLRSQRIDAKSIVGGTTARTSRGVLFTLQHAKRDQPILLEVANDADADAIRHALGIGHGGFGTIGWSTVAGGSSKVGFAGQLLSFLSASALVLTALLAGNQVAAIAAIFIAQFMILFGILALVGRFGARPPTSVVMSAEGLKLQTRQGWFTVPYDHVHDLQTHHGSLQFVVPPPYHFVTVHAEGSLLGPGLGEADRDGLVKQIMSAAARARGLGVSKEDVTGRVDVLRRNGEPARAWLTRLDMTGRMMETSSSGYRGHTLDHEDLWAILEDPDAEAELRAAAARVLRHSPKPETRVRIDAAVAAVRDESVNKRLRIAVRDDVDDASQELAMLDANDPLPAARVMYR